MRRASLPVLLVLWICACANEVAERGAVDSGTVSPPTGLPPPGPPSPIDPIDAGGSRGFESAAPVTRDRPDAGVPSSSADPQCGPSTRAMLVDGLAAAGSDTPITAVVRTVATDTIEIEDEHGDVLTLTSWAAGDLSAYFAPGTAVTWERDARRIRGPRAEVALLVFSLEGQTGPEPNELRVQAWDVVCSFWRDCDLGHSEVVVLNVMLESSGDRMLLQPGTTARVGEWTVAHDEVIAEQCATGRRPPFENQLQVMHVLGE
ncbi:MAG: hypothetical protein IT379_26260 [Deltaproteobacteria bacterium]|nr:hypothetical protein [Deltaproteobacteria bacterium]